MTDFTPEAQTALSDAGQEAAIALMKRMEFGYSTKLTSLGAAIEERLSPEARERIVKAANADPKGVAASIKSGILEDPTVLDRIEKDAGAVLGLLPEENAPAPATAAPTTAPVQEAPPPTAAAPAAPQGETSAQIMGRLSQAEGFSDLMASLQKNPELASAFTGMMGGEGDEAKSKKVLSEIDKAVQADPQFFKKMSSTINKHPQWMAGIADQFTQNPDGAMASMKTAMGFDGLRDMIGGLLSKIHPKLGEAFTGFIDKMGAQISPDLLAKVAPYAAPALEKAAGLGQAVANQDGSKPLYGVSNNGYQHLAQFLPPGAKAEITEPDGTVYKVDPSAPQQDRLGQQAPQPQQQRPGLGGLAPSAPGAG